MRSISGCKGFDFETYGLGFAARLYGSEALNDGLNVRDNEPQLGFYLNPRGDPSVVGGSVRSMR